MSNIDSDVPPKPRELAPFKLDIGRVEAISNLVLIVGVVGVFQGSIQWFYHIGLGLLLLGSLGAMASLILKRVAWQQFIERACLLGMLIGILWMFQPWAIELYQYGFHLLGIATLGYIIITHFPVPDDDV